MFTALRLAIVTLVFCLPACSSAPMNVDPPPLTTTGVLVVSSSPSLGTTLKRTDNITVQLRYLVSDFEGGTYYIVPLFDAFLPGQTAGVPDKEHKRFPRLTSQSAEIDLVVSIPEVLREASISQPLRMRFFLLKATGETTLSIEASTKTYDLKLAAP